METTIVYETVHVDSKPIDEYTYECPFCEWHFMYDEHHVHFVIVNGKHFQLTMN